MTVLKQKSSLVAMTWKEVFQTCLTANERIIFSMRVENLGIPLEHEYWESELSLIQEILSETTDLYTVDKINDSYFVIKEWLIPKRLVL